MFEEAKIISWGLGPHERVITCQIITSKRAASFQQADLILKALICLIKIVQTLNHILELFSFMTVDGGRHLPSGTGKNKQFHRMEREQNETSVKLSCYDYVILF